MNYWIQYDSANAGWLAWYILPGTHCLEWAGPYTSAKAAFIVARWQANH